MGRGKGEKNKMINQIYNYLSPSLCERIIAYHKTSGHRDQGQKVSDFYGRALYVPDIKDRYLKKELRLFEYRLLQLIHNLYKETVYPVHWDIVDWENGREMAVHNDDVKGMEERHYSAICYLNQGFSGGETYFPDHNNSFTPQTGKIIVFPSHYRHGVTKVNGITRYAMSYWATRDVNLPRRFSF